MKPTTTSVLTAVGVIAVALLALVIMFQYLASPKFSDLGSVSSLGEAQRKIAQFTIRLPSNDALPKGFSLKGVVVFDVGSSEYNGTKFRRESAHLLFWDRSIPKLQCQQDNLLCLEEFWYAGGMDLAEDYAPWINDYYARSNPTQEWSDPAWYPIERFVSIFNYRERVLYTVRSCPLPSPRVSCHEEASQREVLLNVAESLKGNLTIEQTRTVLYVLILIGAAEGATIVLLLRRIRITHEEDSSKRILQRDK